MNVLWRGEELIFIIVLLQVQNFLYYPMKKNGLKSSARRVEREEFMRRCWIIIYVTGLLGFVLEEHLCAGHALHTIDYPGILFVMVILSSILYGLLLAVMKIVWRCRDRIQQQRYSRSLSNQAPHQ